MKILVFATALLASLSLTHSSKDSTHYLAAVVEYSPEFDQSLSGLPLVLRNIKHYEDLIARAGSQRADIVVFPEAGLTGVAADTYKHFYSEVPDPKASVTPCLQPTEWAEPLRRLSCAARQNSIYVAVNLNEQNGPKRHNTNVVFDRNGTVVSRFRKLHLFNEHNVQVPDEKELSVFKSDFGVTFGMAICFDIMFREPMSFLANTQNIKHFIYSTAWYSEVPFLTAVQTQAAWAWAHNSVLLASGLNSPHYGNSGSGIYVGRMGPLQAIFTDHNTTELLIARVPKDLSVPVGDSSCSVQTETDREFDSISSGKIRLLKDWIHSFATELLPLEGTAEKNTKLCHEGFCCNFDIASKSHSAAMDGSTDVQAYRLFVWNGVRDFGGAATGGVQLCGVVACRNATDVMTCGLPSSAGKHPRKVQFSKLEIRGAFEATDNTMLLADTLSTYMLPLPVNTFNLTESDKDCGRESNKDVKCMKMSLLRNYEDVRSFAIYNRVFERDGSNYTHTKPLFEKPYEGNL